MLYAMLMAGGRGAASNPSLSFGGSGEHSLFGKLDPIGNLITGIGGDPLNLYGNKANPNALLFPGQAQPNGSGLGTYTPMQSGMTPQQMSVLANMGGNGGISGGLASAFNNYLGAIGQPRMPTQSPAAGGGAGGQLQALMRDARGGGFGMQRPGMGQPMMMR